MLSKEPSSNEIKEEFYIMTILDLIDGATYQQLNEELKRYEEDEMYWQDLTRGAQFEQPGFDILHGYPFRAKADVLGFNYLADLKTTSDLKAFPWAAKKYGYDVQVYIYCNIFGIDYKDFYFFAIDKGTGDLGIYMIVTGKRF